MTEGEGWRGRGEREGGREGGKEREREKSLMISGHLPQFHGDGDGWGDINMYKFSHLYYNRVAKKREIESVGGRGGGSMHNAVCRHQNDCE